MLQIRDGSKIHPMSGMGGGLAETATHRIAIEAYGVRALVSTNSAHFYPLLESALPPGWTPCDPADVMQRFHVVTRDGAFFDVEVDGDETTAGCDLDVAVEVLETRIKRYVALHAPHSIFVHAGAVASRGRAILIPGPTFSGKTTLVSELLRAGADYLSDEYAILDDAGWVSSYHRALAVREPDGGWDRRPQDASDFGAAVATKPVPVGLVVVTQFRAGTRWQPRELTVGDGALALLANTVAAQTRPKEALQAASKAVESAIVLEGDRGEASDIADHVIGVLEGRPLPAGIDATA
jgi:hypothetical protein